MCLTFHRNIAFITLAFVLSFFAHQPCHRPPWLETTSPNGSFLQIQPLFGNCSNKRPNTEWRLLRFVRASSSIQRLVPTSSGCMVQGIEASSLAMPSMTLLTGFSRQQHEDNTVSSVSYEIYRS